MDFQGQPYVSSHVVRAERKKGGKGLSSFFMPKRNNIRSQHNMNHRRSTSYGQHESSSNQQSVSRSHSIDSIGHLSRTPPLLPRNGSIMRHNILESRKEPNKRKSFTGSLSSLLDGQSSYRASHSQRSSQRSLIQEDENRNKRDRRSPHQPPQGRNRTRSNSRDLNRTRSNSRERNRTRSNSRERSFAASLDSLFMVNSFNHTSPKTNRRGRRESFEANRRNILPSQRSRTSSRSRSPPLLPRKGSLKKVNKENKPTTNIRGGGNTSRKGQNTRTGSVHFDETII